MTLDHQGRSLLALLQERHGSDFYQDVPLVSATDEARRLSLSVDGACRMVDLRILDAPRLRTGAALHEALSGAFAAADSERAVAALESSGAFASYAAAGEARITQGRGLRTTPAELRSQPGGGRRGPGAPVRTGRSGNGYLAVTLAEDGRPLHLDVDERWLSAADEQRLRNALTEALTSADEEI